MVRDFLFTRNNRFFSQFREYLVNDEEFEENPNKVIRAPRSPRNIGLSHCFKNTRQSIQIDKLFLVNFTKPGKTIENFESLNYLNLESSDLGLIIIDEHKKNSTRLNAEIFRAISISIEGKFTIFSVKEILECNELDDLTPLDLILSGFNFQNPLINIPNNNFPDEYFRKFIYKINNLFFEGEYALVFATIRTLVENALITLLKTKYGTSRTERRKYQDRFRRGWRFKTYKDLSDSLKDNHADFTSYSAEYNPRSSINIYSRLNTIRFLGNESTHSLNINVRKPDVISNKDLINDTINLLFHTIINI